MIFLNPLLLFALVAAAIPLVIHLFNFRRPRRVQFSSLAFLHELNRSTMQRVRVKQWLLLALRTLVIALMVLAFARPTLQGNLGGVFGDRGPASIAIVLDNSTSMTLRDGSGEYLDQARAIAAGLLSEFESGDEVLIVPAMNIPATIARHQNKTTASKAISSLVPGVGTDRLSHAIQVAARALDESPNLNREIYVVSDFQSSTLTDTSRIDLPDGVRLILLPVGSDEQGNIAVTHVRVLSQIVARGQPVKFQAMFSNYGSEDIRGVVASIYLEGERVGQATVDISAGMSTSARFTITPRAQGWLSGRVEIEDNQYLFDNAYRFTLHVPLQRKILLVNGAEASPQYIRLALSADLVSGSAHFNMDDIEETALARTALGTYDTVILNGVATLSTGEQSAISAYVRGGGGLLVFPGDGMQISDFNGLLSALGGGQILSVPTGPLPAESVGVFDRVDTDHALFEGMFEPDLRGRMPVLEQPLIFQSISYQPAGPSEQTIISLSGGRPFLQEVRAGQGSLFLFSVESSPSWSDFPVRGLFIPLLYRSLYYLSATGSVTGESFETGTVLQIRLPGLPDNTRVSIVDEAGQEYLPEQRSVPGGIVVELSGGFFVPGTYDVVAAGEIVRRLVVQPSALESDLVLSDPEVAASTLSGLTGTEVSVINVSVSGTEMVSEQLKIARSGVELWNVFLGLALIVLVLEMLIAKHFRPEAAL